MGIMSDCSNIEEIVLTHGYQKSWFRPAPTKQPTTKAAAAKAMALLQAQGYDVQPQVSLPSWGGSGEGGNSSLAHPTCHRRRSGNSSLSLERPLNLRKHPTTRWRHRHRSNLRLRHRRLQRFQRHRCRFQRHHHSRFHGGQPQRRVRRSPSIRWGRSRRLSSRRRRRHPARRALPPSTSLGSSARTIPVGGRWKRLVQDSPGEGQGGGPWPGLPPGKRGGWARA